VSIYKKRAHQHRTITNQVDHLALLSCAVAIDGGDLANHKPAARPQECVRDSSRSPIASSASQNIPDSSSDNTNLYSLATSPDFAHSSNSDLGSLANTFARNSCTLGVMGAFGFLPYTSIPISSVPSVVPSPSTGGETLYSLIIAVAAVEAVTKQDRFAFGRVRPLGQFVSMPFQFSSLVPK
jgi:hypothetical protein